MVGATTAAAATADDATAAAAAAATRSFANCDGNFGLEINCTKWITIGRGSDLMRARSPWIFNSMKEIH